MKTSFGLWWFILCVGVCAELPARAGEKSLGVGDKLSMTLTDGTRYSDAEITRVDPDGVAISHASGITKIPFSQMREETRKRFNYDPEKVAASTRARTLQNAPAPGAKAIPPPAPAAPTAPTQPRFSEDAIELFRAVSHGARLNGQFIPLENKPEPILARLSRSSDERVSEAAKAAQNILAHNEKVARAEADKNKRLRKAAGQMQKEIGNAIIDGLTGSDTGAGSVIDQAARITGGAAGQEEVNRYYRAVAEGLPLEDLLKEQLRKLAKSAPVPSENVAANLIARFVEPEGSLGMIEILNRSGKPLHHLLIVPSVRVDRTEIDRFSNMERNVGQFLPLLGVAPAHRDALNDVTSLKADLESADTSRVVYVPLVPANALLRISHGAATSRPYIASVNLWLWCDEATVEGVAIPGIDTLKKTASKNTPTGRNGTAPESLVEKSLRNYKSPLNEPARRLP